MSRTEGLGLRSLASRSQEFDGASRCPRNPISREGALASSKTLATSALSLGGIASFCGPTPRQS